MSKKEDMYNYLNKGFTFLSEDKFIFIKTIVDAKDAPMAVDEIYLDWVKVPYDGFPYPIQSIRAIRNWEAQFSLDITVLKNHIDKITLGDEDISFYRRNIVPMILGRCLADDTLKDPCPWICEMLQRPLVHHVEFPMKTPDGRRQMTARSFKYHLTSEGWDRLKEMSIVISTRTAQALRTSAETMPYWEPPDA